MWIVGWRALDPPVLCHIVTVHEIRCRIPGSRETFASRAAECRVCDEWNAIRAKLVLAMVWMRGEPTTRMRRSHSLWRILNCLFVAALHMLVGSTRMAADFAWSEPDMMSVHFVQKAARVSAPRLRCEEPFTLLILVYSHFPTDNTIIIISILHLEKKQHGCCRKTKVYRCIHSAQSY